MSYELEVSVGSNSTSVSPPLKELEQKPLKSKKQDARDLAELLYDIYTDICPVSSLNVTQDGNSNV